MEQKITMKSSGLMNSSNLSWINLDLQGEYLFNLVQPIYNLVSALILFSFIYHRSHQKMLYLELLIGCFVCFFEVVVSLEFNVVVDNKTIDLLDFLIPTVFSKNERCRNDSLLYRQELSKFTVWAADSEYTIFIFHWICDIISVE